MKVSELKEILASAQKDNSLKIIVECYKAVPKNKKEDLDQVLLSIVQGRSNVDKKIAPEINVDKLIREVKTFIANADEGLYFKPNRIVPKTERSKWRFKASKYFKTLLSLSPDAPEGESIADTLCDFYDIICKACTYYLFRTEDPFSAMGWEKPDLFEAISKFVLSQDTKRGPVFHKIIESSLKGRAYYPLLDQLKRDDYEKTLEILDELRVKYQTRARLNNDNYEFMRRSNIASEFIFSIHVIEGKPVEGYNKFSANMLRFKEDPEVTLYTALDNKYVKESPAVWLKIYERAVSKKIQPRNSLVEQYKRLKNNI